MRQASSTEKFICTAALILGVCLSACSAAPAETLTLGDWIILIKESAGITDSEAAKPYFMNIGRSESCYEAVQAAFEWGVLDSGHAFDPQSFLTNEWAAYTLMNLHGFAKGADGTAIRDISRTQFREQVAAAVASGLMKTDARGLFHPEQSLDRNEALRLLDTVIRDMNDPSGESHTILHEKKGAKIREVPEDAYDPAEHTVIVDDGASYRPGTIIRLAGQHGICLKVISADGNILKTEEASLTDMFDDIDLSGGGQLNPEEAEIRGPDGALIQEGKLLYTGENRFRHVSVHPSVKKFTAGGYDIVIYVSKTGIRAEASRTLKSGAKIYAALRVNDLNVRYSFKTSEDGRKFFRVSFDSEEDFGMKKSSAKTLYGDFSSLNAADFASRLTGLFKERKDVSAPELTLCTIRLPIAGNPLLTALMKLSLSVNMNGKAEIILSQQTEAGFETRNGKTRLIRNFRHEEGASLHGDAKAAASASFSLDLMKQSLMDVIITAGARASSDTILHLYDGENRTAVHSPAAADDAEDLADGNPDVLVCSDMKGNWILDGGVNSAATAAGSLGLGRTFSILNEKNSALIPALCGHFENGHRVAKCTRRERTVLAGPDGIRTAAKIELSSYAMIVNVGSAKSITVSGLPENTGIGDLVYESSDPSVADVDDAGNITGVSSGSAKITVRTGDGMHSAFCSVLVVQIGK